MRVRWIFPDFGNGWRLARPGRRQTSGSGFHTLALFWTWTKCPNFEMLHKKKSLWLMTFRLQYIRRKIKWVIWKYVGNTSFLPNYQNGTPLFDFQPPKIFINSRGFFKLLSVKGGRNCERVEILEKWCRDFKSLVYWHWVYTAVMQCITMNRIKYHLSTLALVLCRQNWVGLKWATVTPTSTIATVKLWSPWTDSL